MDRSSLERLLEIADKLIADGAQQIAQQERIITLLNQLGADTSQATEVLKSRRIAQALFLSSRQRVLELLQKIEEP